MPRLSSLVLKTLAGLGITLPAGGLSWGITLNPTYAATYAAHDATTESNYEFGYNSPGNLACTDNHTIVGRNTSSSPTANWQRYGAAYIFDNNTGELLYFHTPTEPEPGTTNTWFGRSVGISDTHYAIEQERGILYLYDLTTGLLLWRRQSPITTWYASRISFVGPYIILGDRMRGITIYDIATGDTVTPPSLPSGYTGDTQFGMATYATEEYLVTTSVSPNSPYPRAVHIYRTEPGFPYVGTIVAPEVPVSAFAHYLGTSNQIAISAASNRIAIGNTEMLNNIGKIYVYALDTQALLYNIPSPNTSNSRFPTHVRANDTYLYAGHNDSKIRVYDITSGQLVNTISGPDRFGVKFDISSHRLVTSVRDATPHGKVDLYNLYDIL